MKEQILSIYNLFINQIDDNNEYLTDMINELKIDYSTRLICYKSSIKSIRTELNNELNILQFLLSYQNFLNKNEITCLNYFMQTLNILTLKFESIQKINKVYLERMNFDN